MGKHDARDSGGARAALLAALAATSSAFVSAPRRQPPRLPPVMVGRRAAAASGLRRRLVPWRRRTTAPQAAAATGERKGRRGRRAAAAALAALSALWCFRGTAAAATVEGAKTLIEKTASDVGLGESLKALAIAGPRRDALALLLATATVVPLAKLVGLSPIFGFLATGVYLGPSGRNFISYASDGNPRRVGSGLLPLRDGVGVVRGEDRGHAHGDLRVRFSSIFSHAAVLAKGAQVVGAVQSPFSTPASIAVGGALALSSSAFVLQLLKDNEDSGTSHGRASLGVLLLQDLAVVPLLVLVPLLASGDGGLKLAGALAASLGKAVFAVASVEVVGKRLCNMLFDRAKRSRVRKPSYLSCC